MLQETFNVEKRHKIYNWPPEWREELLSLVETVFHEIGQKNFVERFEFFRCREERHGGLHLDSLLERHPIEYGFFLLLTNPCRERSFDLFPGYFSWVYTFCRLYVELSRLNIPGLRDEILVKSREGLGRDKGSEERSMAPIFAHMRFLALLHRVQKDFACSSGKLFGINADIGIMFNRHLSAMDVKCVEQGPAKSGWDGLLDNLIQDSDAVRRIMEDADCYALVTLPELNFFGTYDTVSRDAAVKKFADDLSLSLQGGVAPDSYLRQVEVVKCDLLTREQIIAITNARLPAGYSKKTLYAKRFSDLTKDTWKCRFICFYTRNDVEAHRTNVERKARKAYSQAGIGNGRMVAMDLNFLNRSKMRSETEFIKFFSEAERVTSETVKIIEREVGAYGFDAILLSYDWPVLAPHSMTSTQPLTEHRLFISDRSPIALRLNYLLKEAPFYGW